MYRSTWIFQVATWTIGEYGDLLVSEASNAISMVDEDGVGESNTIPY